MIRWIFVCCLSLFAQRVELYDGWRPDAVGEETFEVNPFYQSIRSELAKIGLSIRNWDRAAHEPLLCRWKRVHHWQDLKGFLLWNLFRKEPLDKDTAYLILSGIGPRLRKLDLGRLPKEKMILFAWEPPTVQPENWQSCWQQFFSKIYTWNDELVDGVKFFKFYLPFLRPRLEELVPYEKRGFLTLIISCLSSNHPHERYSERERVIRYFEEHPEIAFDLYGRGWGPRNFRCWKGTISDKLETLRQYRFSFAYENSRESGYVTEKLWDCFAAGVVPIYSGAPNICEYVPEDCMIHRERFQSDEELVAFLQAMTQEEWEGYVQRAGEFLKTDQARLFTPEHYAETIAEACL